MNITRILVLATAGLVALAIWESHQLWEDLFVLLVGFALGKVDEYARH